MKFGAAFAIVALAAATVNAAVPATEIAALKAFYTATGGANWKNNDLWNEGSDPCKWYGITCSNDTAGNQHIAQILLSNNNLVGTLPEDMGDFPELVAVDFGLNKLTGTLPKSFASLSKMYALSLKENSFSGPIDFSKMTSLQFAHMDFNSFSGTLNNFCTCSSLKVLGLVNNKLTGSIPSCFSNLAKLQTLHLGGNQLTGNVPAFTSDSLRSIDVSRNSLSGDPSFASLAKATGLTEADYFGNKLTGMLEAFAGSSSLVVLDVHDNKFTGGLPATLATNHPNLCILHAQKNALTGFVPAVFSNTTISSLNAAENPFYCPLPYLPATVSAGCKYWTLTSATPSTCSVGSPCTVVVTGKDFVVGEAVSCKFGNVATVPATVTSTTSLKCVVTPTSAAAVQLSVVIGGKPLSATTLPVSFVKTNAVQARRRVGAAPVKVRIHGEAKCPDFGSIAKIFQGIVHKLGESVVEVELGWIMKDIPEYATGFWSLHGQAEVVGNALISCAEKQRNMTVALDFASCLADKIDTIPNNAPACAASNGLDYETVRNCAFSDTGKSLLRTAMELSDADGAVWSPTIYLNDELYCLWHSTPCKATKEEDFFRAVCDAYTGTTPAACLAKGGF